MWDKYEFSIGQHFACALEYGDYSGMEDEEIKEFEEWLEWATEGKAGHWSIDRINFDNYGRCDVTGLFSETMEVSFNFKTTD